MSARIEGWANVGMAIAFVAIAGCGLTRSAMAEVPGARIAVADPPLGSRVSIEHRFGRNGDPFYCGSIHPDASEPSIENNSWRGSVWEGYGCENESFPKLPARSYPRPARAACPRPAPLPIVQVVEACLTRIDVLLGFQQAGACQSCLAFAEVSQPPAEERGNPLRNDSLRARPRDAQKRLDNVPPAHRNAPRNAIPSKEKSLPRPAPQIEDAGQNGSPAPGSMEEESPKGPTTPRNVLPKRVSPPAANTLPKNALPAKSGDR